MKRVTGTSFRKRQKGGLNVNIINRFILYHLLFQLDLSDVIRGVKTEGFSGGSLRKDKESKLPLVIFLQL